VLIVVVNGSTDGTSGYLAGVQDASSVPVTVIANSTNLGFPAAINQDSTADGAEGHGWGIGLSFFRVGPCVPWLNSFSVSEEF